MPLGCFEKRNHGLDERSRLGVNDSQLSVQLTDALSHPSDTDAGPRNDSVARVWKSFAEIPNAKGH